jgi:aryl-alcohol dehydrogenase-like predicted oxidoreductase
LGLFRNYKYGLIGWSALAGGFLTGKHFEGLTEDQVNRFNDKNSPFPLDLMKDLYFDSIATEKNLRSLKELSDLALKELGCKLGHLALAWAIKYEHLDSALVGARNSAQLEDTLKALDVVEKWTPELEGRINKILNNTPEPRLNAKFWKPYPPTRSVAP